MHLDGILWLMYRNQYHIYPKPKRSSTPDISLPPLLKTEKEWHEIRKVIFLDESLNDSGAALYIDGKYIPNRDESGIDFGLALTVSPRWDRQRRCVEFGNWLSSLIEDHEPDIIVGESHPFARGGRTTSTATLEALTGIRWITMYVCGQHKTPYTEFSTNHVKLIMCGSTTASKEAVQQMIVASEIPLPEYRNPSGKINGNVCDAIALCEVVSRMQRQEILLKKYEPVVGKGRSQAARRYRTS